MRLSFAAQKRFELFIALRHLRLTRRRAAQSLTALAGLVGTACGVAALIVAQALANGFRETLQEKILRGTAHITIQRIDGEKFDNARSLAQRVERTPEVVEASLTTFTGALISGREGVTYAVVRGVDPTASRRLDDLRRTLINGSLDALTRDSNNRAVTNESQNRIAKNQSSAEAKQNELTPIIVGAELAARTGLRRVGDEGELIFGERQTNKFAAPQKRNDDDAETFFSLSPRVVRVRVAGVARTGLYEYDATWIYAPLDALGGATTLSVETKDIYDTQTVANQLRAALGENFNVTDWREANRPLFAALALERRVVTLIIALVLVVAALNITTTLTLVVIERRSEIAILSAMGARARSVTVIFLLEGFIIGALGAALGVLCGLAACAACERFGLARLPPDVYSIDSIPMRPHAAEILFAFALALALSILATVYPTRSAARLRPAEVLREE